MDPLTSVSAGVAWACGLFFGSFLNVVSYRLPRGESVVAPGSHCPHCQRPLSPAELVPVFSWLWLWGRCRTCRSPIPVRYPVLELVTGALFAATVWQVPGWPQRAAWLVFWTLMVAVAGTDLIALRVPNVLSLPGAVACTLLSGLTSVQTWAHALTGAAAGCAALCLIHVVSRGNMGLGDAKLYLSVGAMLGPLACLESLALASASGALTGILMRLAGVLQRREPIPFAPHILAGVVLTEYFGRAIAAGYIRLWT
ncbi:MAG: prepilin peptidase [Alicyclobacillaceae bacterium]|nr:prepilin peptidase [Alicyclobacillaceae bacterium]